MSMITVENASKVLEHEGYNSSIIDRAIEAGVIETASYRGFYSAYKYTLIKDSYIDFLHKIGLPERKIDNISDNIQTVS